MKKIAWIALTSLLAAGSAAAQSPLEERMRLEQHMADQLTAILNKFIGPGKSHVTVALTVDVQQVEDKAASARKDKLKDVLSPKIQSTWMWKEVSRKPKLAVLPGFAVSPELSLTENREKRPAPPTDLEEEAGPANILQVKRILVSVVLDSSLSDKNTKMVEVMVSEVLGLDPDRGDRLNIYKVPLQPAWKGTLQKPETISQLLRLAAISLAVGAGLWLLAGLAAKVLRALGLSRQQKAARVDAEAREEKPEGQTKAEAGPGASGGTVSPAAAGEKGVRRPRLDFITEENIEILSELVQDSEPRDIACLLGFLEPAMSAQILDSLPPEKRVKTLVELSSVGFVSPKHLDEMKEVWRERLSHAYGGSAAVSELLSTADSQTQQALFESLRAASPALARKVDSVMIRFEDVLSRKDEHLALIAQCLPFEDWAKALVGCPEEPKKRLLAAMPEVSRPAMQEWLSFTTATQPQIAQARLRVIQAARELRRQGKIDFSKTSARPPIPVAAHAVPAAAEKKA